MNKEGLENSIAIIGISGRFPGAKNLNEFWDNLCNGVESISTFSNKELKKSSLENPSYVNSRAILDKIEYFDGQFFGISDIEAEILDPQHRLFIECCWEALENAGYHSENFAGSIGVYGGSGTSSYFLNHIFPNQGLKEKLGEYFLHMGNERDFLTTRTSYKLNLKGPSLNIQSACSTSLVAVCIACNHLLTYNCDMALAGAASIVVPQQNGYLYQEGMIYSPDGHCRPFDADAKGTVPGNGVGIVLLKRLENALEDRDHIYGIIRGFGLNNDGIEKVGYSAPSIEGQTAAIEAAIEMADIDPETISYIEAHGTGTFLGDPIEIKALTNAFRSYTQKKQYIALGSVKGNLGHLIEAAGITGLIKVVLSMQHKILPPSINYESPNPNIDFENSPFYVNSTLTNWESNTYPRRASISAFGMGGTNSHLILEEPFENPKAPQRRPFYPISISARSPDALRVMSTNLANYLENNSFLPIENVSYTLQVGRKSFDYRLSLASYNTTAAIQALRECEAPSLPIEENPSTIFLIPGQGSQYIDMGRDLYETEDIYHYWIDHCSHLLEPALGTDLRELIFSHGKYQPEDLNQTVYAQPAIFITGYAIAKLWEEWGIIPEAIFGHSLGEYLAACLSGVFSLEDALLLVSERGKIMQAMKPGRMIAVPLSADSIKKYLSHGAEISAINQEKNCVISGSSEAINRIQKELAKDGISSHVLNASHAFHSSCVETVIPEFKKVFKKVKLHPPKIPFISSSTGTWILEEEALSPQYWTQQMRKTVLFNKGVEELLSTKRLFIEIGPGRVLSNLVKGSNHSNLLKVIPSLPGKKDSQASSSESLTQALGNAWALGINVNWNSFYKDEKLYRTPLPTYPFEKKRHWIGSKPTFQKHFPQKENKSTDLSSHTKETLIQIWKEFLGHSEIGNDDSFFTLGGDSLLAIQLISQIESSFNVSIRLQDLVEYSTISQLSRLIGKKIKFAKNTLAHVIVKLKEGSGNPLFFIHPISGNIFSYRSIVDSMSFNGPIYGIQSPSVNAVNLNSIEKIATYYLEAIFKIQKEGPFFIIGDSFGGLVAYEMGCLLKELKKEIGMLVMIDIINPKHPSQKACSKNEMLIQLIELFEGIPLEKDHFLKLSNNEKKERLIQSMHLSGLPQIQQQNLFKQINIYIEAIMNYQPKVYQGDILFCEAQEKFFRVKDLSVSETWSENIIGRINTKKIPGNHQSMLVQPNVTKLANCLDSSLQDLANG